MKSTSNTLYQIQNNSTILLKDSMARLPLLTKKSIVKKLAIPFLSDKE
jgi:hypothetical protein